MAAYTDGDLGPSPKNTIIGKMSSTETFEFTQDEVLAVLAQYISEKRNIAVDPKDFKVQIKDSSRGDQFYDKYEPARISLISISVEK